MATPNIVPRADSEGGLGTASKYWASAYIDFVYVGAGKIGRDSTDLIDFSSDNSIIFRTNDADRLRLDLSQFYPITDNGISLGTATQRFSDLFLASGAVINFDNGNVTLTHSSGQLLMPDNHKLRFGNSGDLTLYHNTDSYIDKGSAGNLIFQQNVVDGDIIFKADNGSGTATAYLTLDGSAGYTTVQKDIHFAPGIRAYFGSGGLLSMVHDNSNGNIINTTGDLTIKNDADNGDIIFKASTGSASAAEYFRLDGGVGHITVQKEMHFQNNVLARFGTNNASQIYHNGTDMLIENNIGDTKITNGKQNKDIIFQGDDGQASDNTVATYFYLDGSSATHDGSATTSLYTNWPDKSIISLGTGHDLYMYHDGSNTYFENEVGNLTIFNKQDDGDIILASDNGSGGTTAYLTLDGGTEQVEITKNMRFTDNVKALFGIGSDLKIYHDSNNSYISDTGTGSLYINGSTVYLRANENENAVVCNFNGSVDLYHDGSASPKLSTTATGVSVTGNVNLTDTTNHSVNSVVNLILNADSDSNSGDAYRNIIFQNRGTETGRIDKDGRLGVGTTVPGTINSVAFSSVGLHTNSGTLGRTITEGSNQAEFIMNDSGASANERAKFIKSDSGVLSLGKFADNGTATDHLSISNSGNVAIPARLGVGANSTDVEAALTIKGDPGNTNQPAKITNSAQDTHTGLFLNSTGNAVNEKYGMQFGGFNEYSVGGIFGLIDSTSASTSGDITIDMCDGTTTNALIERVRFTHEGAVGIGTSSPAYPLDIVGFANSTSGFRVTDGTIDNRISWSSGNVGFFGTISNHSIAFNTNSTVALTIDTSQNATFAGTVYIPSKLEHTGDNDTFLNFSDDTITLSAGGASTTFAGNGNATFTGDVSITSTAAGAVGGGFDGAETVAIQIGEVNQEIITTISIDLGTGGATDIVSSGTAGDVIGENDTAAAFITKYDSTKSGVLYKAELICLETPAGGDTDINLVLNATSLAEDAASEAEGHVIIDGGAQTIGMRTESTASVITAAAGAHNDYIYLAHGGTTAGTYSAGKFLIRLYGAKATL